MQTIHIPKTIVVQGSSVLSGRVNVQGSKNSALSLIPSLLLANGISTLGRVPDLLDIHYMLSFVESLGAKVIYKNNLLEVNPDVMFERKRDPDIDHLRRIRAAYYFIPVLLRISGTAILPMPGGCPIGARKSDFLFDALVAFGADVSFKDEYVYVEAKQLRAVKYKLPYPSQSVSAILLDIAVLAEGETILENISKNPEIENKLSLLRSLGADITSRSDGVVHIIGNKDMNGVDFNVMSDRIVAATWIAAAGITNGIIELPVDATDNLGTEMQYFRSLGLIVDQHDKNWTRYSFAEESKPISVETGPYPSFGTDIQPFITVLASARAAWGSTITERVFDKRFRFIEHLESMGYRYELKSSENIVCPNGESAQIARVIRMDMDQLAGCDVEATDLRAGMALLLAGCRAKGHTRIRNAEQLYRGYENFENIISELGGMVTKEV